MRYSARRSWVSTGLAVILLMGIVTLPASAHHSFAMYDTSIEKPMTGKLVRFVLGANHSQFIFDLLNNDGTPVLDDKGMPVTWNVETTSSSQLARQGITVKSFLIGTIFTVTLSPLRDGRNGGAQRGSLVMCGMKMPAGGCNENTGKKY